MQSGCSFAASAMALLLSSGTAVAVPSTAQLIDAAEIRVVESTFDRYAQDVALLTQTVDINSGTLNLEGVRRVGRVFAREFKSLGFTVRWVEGAEFGRASHMIAQRGPVDSADGTPHFLLIGHLDTVFEPDSPFQAMRIEQTAAGAFAHGPGAVDMKGGNVVMLSALRGLAAAGVLDSMRVTVFLASDEERVGIPLARSRAELMKLGRAADVALGFEDGDGDPATAVIARRGSSRWRLTIEATPAHSSQIFQPEVGGGAIYEAARIMEGFRTGLADLDQLTYSPGLILGGTEVEFDPTSASGNAFGKNNVVPQKAIVTGDIRAVSGEQLQEAIQRMEAIASESLPGTQATFEFEQRYPPMDASAGNRRLLSIYDRASRDLSAGPVAAVDPRKAGAADIAFVAGDVEMALDGLGLMGRDGHTVDETADLSTLSSQAARAALTMLRLHSERSSP